MKRIVYTHGDKITEQFARQDISLLRGDRLDFTEWNSVSPKIRAEGLRNFMVILAIKFRPLVGNGKNHNWLEMSTKVARCF